jgi:predicted unusual protein kinase regulating ubiquinone biosynthesis (AarF/ABC1/UbiB family)
VERVLEREWEQPVADVLADVEPVAAAAASVGQVHRARLADGSDVAVKVQYAGVEEAIRADLQNVGMLTRLAKVIAPGIDASALAREVRDRVIEELDFELEAGNQRQFARAYRGHPFICVPRVHTALSRRRVLVTDWVDGTGFDAVRDGDQDDRDRFGEIFFRFYFGSLHRLRAFNADPHPGNLIALDDGRIAFLDFGTVGQMSPARVDLMKRTALAAVADDAEAFHAAINDLGYLARPDRLAGKRLLEAMRASGSWFLEDREVTIDAPLVRAAISSTSDPRSGFYDVIRNGRMPPQDILFRRMEASVVSVLAMLEATANWSAIAHEWWADGPPATALGEADQAFWSSRQPPVSPL